MDGRINKGMDGWTDGQTGWTSMMAHTFPSAWEIDAGLCEYKVSLVYTDQSGLLRKILFQRNKGKYIHTYIDT